MIERRESIKNNQSDSLTKINYISKISDQGLNIGHGCVAILHLLVSQQLMNKCSRCDFNYDRVAVMNC